MGAYGGDAGLFTGVEDHLTEIPGDFALLQNYPNPFNPATEIGFTLSRASHVKLEIFNIIGQKVSTLVDCPTPAGYHTVSWDASQLSSGLYLYRMQAGDFARSKKMLLVK
jgi:hypothetical protein